MATYKAKSGDTISTVAQKTGVPEAELRWENQGVKTVKPGQVLSIPKLAGAKAGGGEQQYSTVYGQPVPSNNQFAPPVVKGLDAQVGGGTGTNQNILYQTGNQGVTTVINGQKMNVPPNTTVYKSQEPTLYSGLKNAWNTITGGEPAAGSGLAGTRGAIPTNSKVPGFASPARGPLASPAKMNFSPYPYSPYQGTAGMYNMSPSHVAYLASQSQNPSAYGLSQGQSAPYTGTAGMYNYSPSHVAYMASQSSNPSAYGVTQGQSAESTQGTAGLYNMSPSHVAYLAGQSQNPAAYGVTQGITPGVNSTQSMSGTQKYNDQYGGPTPPLNRPDPVTQPYTGNPNDPNTAAWKAYWNDAATNPEKYAPAPGAPVIMTRQQIWDMKAAQRRRQMQKGDIPSGYQSVTSAAAGAVPTDSTSTYAYPDAVKNIVWSNNG